MARDRHSWNGKSIVDAKHAQDLENHSAELEFKDRLSRENAESQAYREYRKKHHLEAAAHHLRGMKSAQGSGDADEARKHGAMYEMHMGKLGEEPWREPSRELKAAMGADDRQAVHKFKPHAADAFVLDEAEAKDSAAKVEKSLTEIYVKAHALEMLVKAFPTDPTQPVGSHLDADDRAAIRGDAMTSEELADPHGRPADQINAANRPRPSGKPISMVSSKRLAPDQPMIPNKNQAGVAAALRTAGPETHVLVDHLLERGAQFTKPPEFEPQSAARAHPAEGGGRPGQPVTQADLDRAAQSAPLQQANRQMATQHPDLGAGDPMVAFDVPGPAMMGTPNAWKSPSNIRNSQYLDDSFWSSVSRMAGLPNWREQGRPITEEQFMGTKKAEPPGMSPKPAPAAPAGMAAPAKPQLHGTVEGFMGGLKSMPKGSPERGRFITAHMSHPAFIGALQAHPAGKQIHSQLTTFMNSTANAGPKAPMKVVAKSLGDHVYDAIIGTLPLPMQIAGHAAKAIFKPVLQPIQKSEEIGNAAGPRYSPGSIVHDGDRNLIVLKVHPGRAHDDEHLYSLRDPVDQTVSHAFESKLSPSKELHQP